MYKSRRVIGFSSAAVQLIGPEIQMEKKSPRRMGNFYLKFKKYEFSPLHHRPNLL
jgi:hypothetical protein